MRIITTTLIAVQAALLSTVCAQQTHLDIKVPERVERDLFGPVKSVSTDLSFNMSDNHTKELDEYDRAGNLTAESEWDSDDELANTSTNYYDENGCFYRHDYISLGRKGSTNEWEVILSPETRQIAMKNKRTGSITIRTYSPDKYLLHYKEMDRGKKLVKASRTKRRADNREEEYATLDEKNRPVYTYYYRWDDRGFIDRERVRYHQKKKERLHTYDHLVVDEHGNWTQQLMTRYDVGGTDKTKVYEKLKVRNIEYYEDD